MKRRRRTGTTTRRCSGLQFILFVLLGASDHVSLCTARGGRSNRGDFDSLVGEYKEEREEARASLEEYKQKYLEDVDEILVETGVELAETEAYMSNCVASAQVELGMGSSQYRERTMKCLTDFTEWTDESWAENLENVGRERNELREDIQELEEQLDRRLAELRDKSEEDPNLNDTQRLELQTLEEERGATKMEQERMLRTFDAEFGDTICIDIDNVGTKLGFLDSLELARVIIPYVSQDLTDLGMDYYIGEVSLVNQTIDYNNTSSSSTGDMTEPQENGRGLRSRHDGTQRLMSTMKPRLLTQWDVKIKYHRGITSLDQTHNCTASADCHRNLAARAAKSNEEENSFKRLLWEDGTDIEEFRLAELGVQHIFESRLMNMKHIVTEGTTVQSMSCGAWSLTDPTIITINPEQLKDFEEFREAHAKIAEKEAKETQKYEEKVEEEYAEYQHEVNKQELKYMSCLNHYDQKLVDGKISLEQREIEYDECFEQHDAESNDLLQDYIRAVERHKEPFMKKMEDLEEKMIATLAKLNEKQAQFASKYLAELAKEKREQGKTMEQILEERKKLELKLQRGIVCEIDGLRREFFDAEIPILEDLIERGANYALTMCKIDLHVYETIFLGQEYSERRLKEPNNFGVRKLGSTLAVRFDSKWGCTRCTKCTAYSDSSSSTNCECCLRRRLSSKDIFIHAQVPDCFDMYLTPRVKQLIESRLKSAMEDRRDEVYVVCSTFDEESRRWNRE